MNEFDVGAKPMQRHQLGREGEIIGADYLRGQGYEILDRRYRRRGGEIDIVCCLRDGEEVSLLVFVEVKTRRPTAFGRPEQAVSRQKMRRIYSTASAYLHEHPHPGVLCRFDVIAVYCVAGRLEVVHFVEAFGPGELMDMD